MLQHPGGARSPCAVGGEIRGPAAPRVIGAMPASPDGPVRLVAASSIVWSCCCGVRAPPWHGFERGDLGSAKVQSVAGLGVRQGLSLVARDLQSREVGLAAGALDFAVGLHLGIGTHEITGHHLLAECFGRRLDQEGDGERQVVRSLTGFGGDESLSGPSLSRRTTRNLSVTGRRSLRVGGSVRRRPSAATASTDDYPSTLILIPPFHVDHFTASPFLAVAVKVSVGTARYPGAAGVSTPATSNCAKRFPYAAMFSSRKGRGIGVEDLSDLAQVPAR